MILTDEQITALADRIADAVAVRLGSKPERSELLTKAEAAAYLKVSGRTLQKLVSDGRVRRAFATGRPRFRRSDLDTYVSLGTSGVVYRQVRQRRAK